MVNMTVTKWIHGDVDLLNFLYQISILGYVGDSHVYDVFWWSDSFLLLYINCKKKKKKKNSPPASCPSYLVKVKFCLNDNPDA